ncbi:type II secretion system F family protein [Intrasporangium sp.]|uniref:type II secretion system F family protein n=1 Tax=Intrasporangium sp. TaxID=1925024 RepID=UPI00322167FC
MTPAGPLGALAGMLLTGGALLVYLGATRRDRPPPPTGARAGLFPRARAGLAGAVTRRELLILAVTALAGLSYAARTGFWAAALLAPAAAWGLPRLLAAPPATPVARLDALAQWTRRVAGLIESGHQLNEALIASARATPPAIQPQVQALVNRIRARQPVHLALYQFGDEMADPVADKVVAALIKAATVTSSAVAAILGELARMTADEVHYRHQLAAAQAGPRTTARVVTGIVTLILIGFVFFTPQGAAYQQPLGQLVLLALSVIYGGLLWWIRAASLPPVVPRFIRTPAHIRAQLGGGQR